MKLKKILALVVVAVMLCTVVVSVGAANYDYDQKTIYDVHTGSQSLICYFSPRRCTVWGESKNCFFK